MENMTNRIYSEVELYVKEHIEDIESEIADLFNWYKSPVNFCSISFDYPYEIVNIYESDDHLYEVCIYAIIEEGYNNPSCYPEPDSRLTKCMCRFYVELLDDEQFRYGVYRLKNGEIDIERTIDSLFDEMNNY